MFAREFNEAYDTLKAEIQKSLDEPNYERLMTASFVVRFLQCAIVWIVGWPMGLAAGLLQFLVAPLSLSASFIRLLTNLSDCLLHYSLNLVVAIVCWLWAEVRAGWPKLVVNPSFVVVFFTVDFVLNLFVYARTAEKWEARRLATHILYGTFNTKTYFVVVLGCLYGMEFDLFVVAGTAVLSYFWYTWGCHDKLLDACGAPGNAVTFYVEHRLGHMPIVYQHAHKLHHYLHDTTAFDAHIYGSGMNEEFFWILVETLPCLAFPSLLFPYFLNGKSLYDSWQNKGGHSRNAHGVGNDTFGSFDADNFHADHHTYHRANFCLSSASFMDLYFGTAAPGFKGYGGRDYRLELNASDKSQIFVYVDASKHEEQRRCVDVHPPEQKQNEGHSSAGNGNVPLEWQEHRVSDEELASRCSEEAGGLWVALHGGIFDLTTFHRIHPGGPEVLRMYAGKDATSTFDEIGHSDRARSMARKRLIGVLSSCSPTGFVADMLCDQKSSKVEAAYSATTTDLSAPLLAVGDTAARD
eukprot:TRINITY_DN48427_c0_g1_i1.p1 TRINITY_DN48427_c0_g1~~TRINITY_DN48427_c0_g1_i1.p1  ORF type:complete len:604 (-),score=72.55 TRINITY_DN48427_c0_g1_i1:122-1690(-)